MSYRPFSLPSSHSAARTAPRAKVMRLEALWVISTRSPSAANSTVWSPTTSPARTVAKPMVSAPARRSALASVDRHFLEVPAERLGHHLAHAQGGAGRRIDLVPVMGLDDLDIHFIAQHPCRGIQKLQTKVHADAEVGSEDDRDILRRFGQQQLLVGAEAGGADDHRAARLAALLDVLQGYGGMGEVDQDVELLADLAQIPGQRHADPAETGQLAGVRPHQGAIRTIHRRRQPGGTAGLLNGLDQVLAHARRRPLRLYVA